ncbi:MULTISPECIES: hypothetical protein [unclassified Methanoculleus]|jgi:hypothetical protein|uniref:Uncharacterized protein n=1 Tax=Methanoculleus palmolei TaxID=72612 RepID=A0ABD8A6A4_9EURY|nr:hypothetical protein [Methanoculleus sp. UBA377]WOX55077.1 hypothetical protein R6Y95_06265 [Methanoculleus palmolei]
MITATRTTKALLTRTRGKTWDVIPGTEEGEFIRVQVVGRHASYYCRRSDLDGRRQQLYLYELTAPQEAV